MTWFVIDDTFAFHPKVVAAGNALTLWVRAGAWCAQQLTDGHVPSHMIPALGTKRDAGKLVEVGLWERVEDGYVFHDWSSYQQSREEVERKRRQSADRVAKWRKRQQDQGVTPDEDVKPSARNASRNGVRNALRTPLRDALRALGLTSSSGVTPWSCWRFLHFATRSALCRRFRSTSSRDCW